MIKGIIYLLGLCTLAMILAIVAVVLCLSNIQWGEYAQKGQDMAKAKITEAVKSAIEEAAGNVTGEPGTPHADTEATQATSKDEPAEVDPPTEKPNLAKHHWVKKGETLFSISLRYYGDGGRWKEIARANGIEDPSSLGAGMRLAIP